MQPYRKQPVTRFKEGQFQQVLLRQSQEVRLVEVCWVVVAIVTVCGGGAILQPSAFWVILVA